MIRCDDHPPHGGGEGVGHGQGAGLPQAGKAPHFIIWVKLFAPHTVPLSESYTNVLRVNISSEFNF